MSLNVHTDIELTPTATKVLAPLWRFSAIISALRCKKPPQEPSLRRLLWVGRDQSPALKAVFSL